VLETVNFEQKFSSLPEFNPQVSSQMPVSGSTPSFGGNVVYTTSLHLSKTTHGEDDIGSDATATPRYFISLKYF
jgi:hypothetical protein